MITPEPPPEWLTTGEVAERFTVSKAAVVRWLENGDIPREHWIRTPSRYGHYRIRAAWMDAYLNGSGSA